MPSESASIMKKAYQELLQLTEKAVYLTSKEEDRIQAEIEIRFGLSPNRAKRMIDNMVKTGRIERHEESKVILDARQLLKEKTKPKISKKEMEEVEARLQAKPGGKK